MAMAASTHSLSLLHHQHCSRVSYSYPPASPSCSSSLLTPNHHNALALGNNKNSNSFGSPTSRNCDDAFGAAAVGCKLVGGLPWQTKEAAEIEGVCRGFFKSSRRPKQSVIRCLRMAQQRSRPPPSTTRRKKMSCISCSDSSSSEQPSTASSSASDEADITELPCLPFTPAEVFVPSSTKVLHLYEARFLALLEEVLGKYDNLFAHIVIEPMGSRGQEDEGKGVASFIATYGCLARVEKVQRLEIGAEVTIRGIGRIKLIGLTQLEPFLKGTLVSLKDETPQDAGELESAIHELRTTLSTVQQLQIKLKVRSDEPLQTPLEKALQWAERGEPDHVAAQSYLPSREERVSFAALQPVAGASAADQHKLLQERLYAMEAMDTLQRLNRVKPFAERTLASLAAKVSIQSLNL